MKPPTPVDLHRLQRIGAALTRFALDAVVPAQAPPTVAADDDPTRRGRLPLLGKGGGPGAPRGTPAHEARRGHRPSHPHKMPAIEPSPRSSLLPHEHPRKKPTDSAIRTAIRRSDRPGRRAGPVRAGAGPGEGPNRTPASSQGIPADRIAQPEGRVSGRCGVRVVTLAPHLPFTAFGRPPTWVTPDRLVFGNPTWRTTPKRTHRWRSSRRQSRGAVWLGRGCALPWPSAACRGGPIAGVHRIPRAARGGGRAELARCAASHEPRAEHPARCQ
jgi:hypothetical protein